MRVPEPPCLFCDEPVRITDGAELVNTPEGPKPAHPECNFRAIMGSVAHIEKRCGCFVKGSEETDPVEMSRRDAAKAAVAAYYSKRRPRLDG